MKKIDEFIPLALEAAKLHLAKDGKIAKECNGYISSFGASVIQSGLLPAIVSNEKQKHKERRKVMKSILDIITKDETTPEGNLFQYVIDNTNNYTDITKIRLLKSRIIIAATALKLAIRTFKLVETENSDE